MIALLRRFLPAATPVRKAPPVRRLTFRPRLEGLDDRITPASFASAQALNLGAPVAANAAPRAVAVADLNGDGRADLVVSRTDPASSVPVGGAVTVRLNTGTAGAPAFGPLANVTVGNNPTELGVGDFNGDGRSDLAVLNSADNTVSVLLNTTAAGATTASFAAKRDIATGVTGVSGLAVGDFNSDGRSDLAVSFALGGGGVRVLRNTTPAYTTTAGFVATGTFAVPNSTPTGLVATDLDGDGRTDLAVCIFGANQVAVLRNTTALSATPTVANDPVPTFAAQQLFNAGTNPDAIAVGDFDGDGRSDLAVTNDGTTVSVLRNSTTALGTIALAAPLALTVGTAPRSLTVGDFDGNGQADLAVANAGGDTVSVLENTTAANATAPTFAAAQSFATGTGTTPRAVAVADFDGDGRSDLVTGHQGTNQVAILRNVSTTPDVVSFGNATLTGFFKPAFTLAADLDGDFLGDLIVVNSNSSTVSVQRNTTPFGSATITFAAQQTFAVGSRPESVAVGDLDGDGKLDLAVANFGGGTVSVLRNTGTAAGTVAFAAQQTFAVGSRPESVAVGDLDGDGKLDLAVANSNSGTVSVLRNTGTAAGTVAFAAQQTFAVGSGPVSVAVGDLDGDGKLDLAVANFGDDTVSVLRNTGTAAGTVAFAAQQTFAVGSSPISVAVGDLDGDGKLDLAVANFGGDTVSVLRNTGTAAGTVAFAAQQTFAVGSRPESVAVGDLDGDFRDDLIVANSNSGTVSVLRNTGTAAGTVAFAAQQTFAVGSRPESVAVGDFNEDFRDDLIVANSNSGTVSVLRGVPSVAVSAPSVVVSRGAAGVWAYDRVADNWRQLLSTAAGAVASAPNGNAIAVFPGFGTYYYRASDRSWTRLHTSVANVVAMDRLGNAYANYTNFGTYLFRPSGLASPTPQNAWVKLGTTGATADKLAVGGNGDVVANFIGYGVHRFRPSVSNDFVLLNGVDAAALAVGDTGQIAVTFARQANGIYLWRDGPNPSWAVLHGYNATNLAVDANGNVAAALNSPTQPGGVQVMRSRAVVTNTPGNLTAGWTTLHTGTAATSVAMDLFGNVFARLGPFGVYEFGVNSTVNRQRWAFPVISLSVGR